MCQFNRCNDFITIYLLDSCMTMYECVFSIHVKIKMKTIKKSKKINSDLKSLLICTYKHISDNIMS